MAKKKVNVALVGAQFMGKAHSNAWRKVGMFFDAPVEPVMKVLCGKFKEEVAVAEKWGWQETSLDWKEVVNRPDIDIVDICTPNFLHPAIAIEAAKAGKHIVCEKPLANTLKEAQDMLKAADKAGVKHMCGFSYRFAPAVQTIKNMIVKKELGDIYHFRAAYQQDWIADPDFPMVWRLKKKHTGSGALGDFLADPDAEAEVDNVGARLLPQELEALLEVLDERERTIVELRYGMDGGEPRSVVEVAEELDLSRERIRQLEHRALAKLTHPSWRAMRKLSSIA